MSLIIIKGVVELQRTANSQKKICSRYWQAFCFSNRMTTKTLKNISRTFLFVLLVLGGSLPFSKNAAAVTDADVDGYSTDGTIGGKKDCNDNNPKISPAASEVCDSIDNNCDGKINEGLTMYTYYTDIDKDGYGKTALSPSCKNTPPSGATSRGGDCNDANKSISPSATEICDALDNNCNSKIDDGLTTKTYYTDGDKDGYGATILNPTCQSVVPTGASDKGGDCNDASATEFPGNAETCDSIDNNCDGNVDEGLPTTTSYQDADGDGYGDAARKTVSCSTMTIMPSGFVATRDDCDDGNSAIHPGVTDTSNGVDDDCDGSTDEDAAVVDGSSDGSDAASTTVSVTLATEGSPELDIYYADTASEDTIVAATELKIYLDKITGGSFMLSEISVADAEADGAKGIFVGTVDDFPSMPDADLLVVDANDPTTNEAFTINSLTDQIWLGGTTDVAVQHAVTRILDEFGCRWFFQGPTWEVVPSTPTLTFSKNIFEQPKMAYRMLQTNCFNDTIDEPGSLQCDTDRTDWLRHNHLRYLNSKGTAYTGAALSMTFQQVWTELSIPEINTFQGDFLNLGGTAQPDNRYGWLTATGLSKSTIEISNEDVRNAYWTWLTERWAKVYEPDGYSMPMEEGDGGGIISQSTNSLSINSECAPSCTDSDQMVTLANDMTDRAASDPAMSDRYATFLAGYSHLLPPTIEITGKTWVGVFPIVGASVGEFTTTTALLDGWAAKGARLSIFDNFAYQDRSLLGSNYRQSFDGMSWDVGSDSVTLSSDIRSYVDHGLTAAALETEGNFGHHGLGYYLMTRLLWDPYADVDALRSDFFEKAFGAAKTNMQNYYDLFDPKGQPQLVSKDLMAQAYAYLDAATTDAGSDSAVIARINDLKCYMHHNALWWQIYRAESNSDAQKQLVRDLLSWDYRIRSSYMAYWDEDLHDANGVIPASIVQFGAAADWSATDSTASWRATSTYPTQTEIDAAFTEDATYFAPDSVTQLTWTGQPEAVSDFNTMSGATQGEPRILNYVGGKPYALALYTPAGQTSIDLSVMAGSQNTASSPASPLTITLTDASGTSYGTQTISPTNGTPTYQTVTFSSLPEKTGFLATVNDYGSYSDVKGTTASRVDSPMSFELDKIARSSTGIYSPTNGLYFYVPKGTTEIQYFWNRLNDTSAADGYPLARPFSGKGCYKDTTVSWTAVTTDADGTQTHCILAPDGTITTVNDFQQVIRVPVTSGNDGKVWQIMLNTHGASAKQLWFYNIPPYVATSPTSLVIPHDLVVKDGLTPR